MSSSIISSLPIIGQQIAIYGGIIVFTLGVIGGLLNIIVFLSLETFRQSSCAFYLTIMSIVNIGQLLFGLLSRIMINGFLIDWTTTSLFYCKFRLTFFQLCSLISYSCLCLATIDQYFATCTRRRWQQWSNIKLAQRLIIISLTISIILLAPYPIFYSQVKLATGAISCTFSNYIVSQYRSYFVSLFLVGYIPDFITVLFGILAYRNIQQISYRTVPLIRRELDKQLTTMVLVQVILNLFVNIPYVSILATLTATSNVNDPVFTSVIQFIFSVVVILFYTYFASSFYIYMFVSERFRRQFTYVMFDIHLTRWRQRRERTNQVVPA